jgi:urocanate hydratase
LTAGLGGMGGAQPLAATMAGASILCIECQQSRIQKRLDTRYLDAQAPSLDAALKMISDATAARRALSVGVLGNAAGDASRSSVRRGVRPDAVTDQTSAHDLVNGYLPLGWTVEQWLEMRTRDPLRSLRQRRSRRPVHVKAMLDYHAMGVPTFDYGNNIARSRTTKA